MTMSALVAFANRVFHVGRQDIPTFATLPNDIMTSTKRWQEWAELGGCEDAALPGPSQ